MRNERSRNVASQPCLIDPLEARRMLSVSVSKGGTLSVVGTNHSDTIYVQMHRHDAKHIDVFVNGTTTTVAAAGVKAIVVQGGARNDSITLSDRNGRVVGKHDLVGGTGDDSLTGDAANDRLEGDAGDDSLNGGAGDDSLDGGDGNDSLNGDVGNDSLTGDAGDDSLDGGSGTDDVQGGGGADHFHGNDDGSGEIKDQGTGDVNDDNGNDGAGHDSIIGSMKVGKDVFAG